MYIYMYMYVQLHVHMYIHVYIHVHLHVHIHVHVHVHVSLNEFLFIMQATLSKKFKVSGIPTLVFVNGANGQLITSDGRSIVVDDTEGNDFPWTPKPVVELLSGKVKTKTGETTWAEVKEKVDVIGIYFSAHWVNHKIVITCTCIHAHVHVCTVPPKYKVHVYMYIHVHVHVHV